MPLGALGLVALKVVLRQRVLASRLSFEMREVAALPMRTVRTAVACSVDDREVVAVMTDIHARREGAVVQLVPPAVGHHGPFAGPRFEQAVSVVCS